MKENLHLPASCPSAPHRYRLACLSPCRFAAVVVCRKRGVPQVSLVLRMHMWQQCVSFWEQHSCMVPCHAACAACCRTRARAAVLFHTLLGACSNPAHVCGQEFLLVAQAVDACGSVDCAPGMRRVGPTTTRPDPSTTYSVRHSLTPPACSQQPHLPTGQHLSCCCLQCDA
jgi:hypothetical protein